MKKGRVLFLGEKNFCPFIFNNNYFVEVKKRDQIARSFYCGGDEFHFEIELDDMDDYEIVVYGKKQKALNRKKIIFDESNKYIIVKIIRPYYSFFWVSLYIFIFMLYFILYFRDGKDIEVLECLVIVILFFSCLFISLLAERVNIMISFPKFVSDQTYITLQENYRKNR